MLHRYDLAGMALALCTVGISSANAAPIVDTGAGPNNPNTQWALTNGQYLAAEFSIESNDTIRSVEGYIGGISSQTVTVKIFTDGGDIPGSVLYSGSFNTVVTTSGAAQWQGLFGQNWALNAGTYWVGFEGTASNSTANAGYLNGSAPRPLVNEAFSVGGTSAYRGADTLDLSIRINSDPTAPVPEPASWVLMIAGFGVVGGAMRRRRIAVAFG